FRAMGGWPSMGSLLSKLYGSVDPSVPPFVGLAAPTKHMPWSDSGKPGFLGAPYAAFRPDGNGMSDLELTSINQARPGGRKQLLASFDRMRRDADTNMAMRGTDAATSRALDVLLSSRLIDAMDISKEPDKVRDRYGDGKPYKYQFDGAPTCSEQLLMARRL